MKTIIFCITFLSSMSYAVESTTDLKNNPGKRILGKWTINIKLSKQLQNRKWYPFSRLEFAEDETIIKKLPIRYRNFLKNKKIYVSGYFTMTMNNQYPSSENHRRLPFIMVSRKGNYMIIYFKQLGENEMGATETISLMIGEEENKQNDFIIISNIGETDPTILYQRVN